MAIGFEILEDDLSDLSDRDLALRRHNLANRLTAMQVRFDLIEQEIQRRSQAYEAERRAGGA